MGLPQGTGKYLPLLKSDQCGIETGEEADAAPRDHQG